MSLSLFFVLRYEYINLSMSGCVGLRTEGLAASGGEKDSFKPNLVNRVKSRPVCEVYILS